MTRPQLRRICHTKLFGLCLLWDCLDHRKPHSEPRLSETDISISIMICIQGTSVLSVFFWACSYMRTEGTRRKDFFIYIIKRKQTTEDKVWCNTQMMYWNIILEIWTTQRRHRLYYITKAYKWRSSASLCRLGKNFNFGSICEFLSFFFLFLVPLCVTPYSLVDAIILNGILLVHLVHLKIFKNIEFTSFKTSGLRT